MSIASRTYCPRAGSLPARVIQYFAAHMGDTLSAYEIAQKFDAPREGLVTNLKMAVEAGFLNFADGKYTVGESIDEAPDYGKLAAIDETIAKAKNGGAPSAHNVFATAVQVAHEKKSRTASYASVRHILDIANLKVEEDVPYFPNGTAAMGKWEPLFSKLVKKGQSIAVPAHLRGALAAAANKRNKENRGTFKVALASPDTARIWRIA